MAPKTTKKAAAPAAPAPAPAPAAPAPKAKKAAPKKAAAKKAAPKKAAVPKVKKAAPKKAAKKPAKKAAKKAAPKNDRGLRGFDSSDPSDVNNTEAFHKRDKYDTTSGWDDEDAGAAKADPWAGERRDAGPRRPVPSPPFQGRGGAGEGQVRGQAQANAQGKPESLEDTLARAVEEAFGGGPRQAPEGQGAGAGARKPSPVAREYSYAQVQAELHRRYGGQLAGAETVARLVMANSLVWLGWKLPLAPVRAFLERNFLTSPVHMASRPAPWGWLTNLWCTYSHSSFMHLAANMLGLVSFGPPLMDTRWHSVQAPTLSVASFLAMYHTAGVLGSLGSNAFSAACGASRPALGASGAVFGALTYFTACHPDNGVAVLFIIRTDATTAMWGATAVNIGLSVAQWAAARQGRLGPGIDGTAHLVGTAVGLAWYYAARAGARSSGAPDKPTRQVIPRLAPSPSVNGPSGGQEGRAVRVGQPGPGQGVQV